MSLHATIARTMSATFRLEIAVEIPPGITILFGPSGSGKSTVLRCIAGLIRPDAGHIALDDRVWFDHAQAVDLPPARRRVGLVFQQLALFPHLTVAANIGYGLHRAPRTERDERIAQIAESFRIAHVLQRRPGQISGGERQRTALARTLVTEPSALLLDEPLTALDHRMQSHLIDDLRRWNEVRRIPVLYVTHTHREVYALGERVIVMDRGTVVATGPPHQVLDHPAAALVAELSGFENLIESRIISRRQDAGTMRVRLGQSRVELEVPLTETADERVTLAIRGGDILVATARPTGISARNVIQGTITSLERHGATVLARVASADVTFTVHLTPASLEDLHLSDGSPVWLIIKTYSCRIAAG